MSNFIRTFGPLNSPVPLSYLDDNFGQIQSTGTSTVSLAGSQLLGFIQNGSGAVARTAQSKMQDFVNAADFGFSTANSSAQNATALNAALAYAATSALYRRVVMPPGSFAIDPITMPVQFNITLAGTGSAYGYGDPVPGTTLVFTNTGGTTGITQGAGVTNPGPYNLYEDFCIDGNSVLAHGIEVKGQMLVNRVTVKGCTTSGFHLSFVNQSHLDQCTAVSNGGDGLLVDGSSSTIYSVSRSNFRSNTGNGINLQDGTHGLYDRCVFESNTGFGSYFYLPSGGSLDHMTFQQCWWEANGADLSSSYQCVLDSFTGVAATSPGWFDFLNCRFNGGGSSRRNLHITSAILCTFYKCDFLNGDQSNNIVIGNTTHVSRVGFWDRNGPSGGSDPFTQNSTCFDLNMAPSSGAAGLQSSAYFSDLSRTVPMGVWTAPAFSAGDFTGDGTITWTVASGDVTTYKYMLVGKTMTVVFVIATTTTGGSASTRLKIAIPASATSAVRTVNTIKTYDNGTERLGVAEVTAGGTTIDLLTGTYYTNTNWSNASTDNTFVAGEITFEIQ